MLNFNFKKKILIFFVFILFASDVHAVTIALKSLSCVQSPKITLREIASPSSDMPTRFWNKIADLPLMNAPQTYGYRLRISEDEMLQALRKTIGSAAGNCLIPRQMLVQRGGRVWDQLELRLLVDKFLTQRTANSKGEVVLRDHKLPNWIFSGKLGENLEIEPARKLAPGRISLRFLLKAQDGRVVRRFSGSVFMDQWQAVVCAARPLNRGEDVLPEDVTFERKNLAYLREAPWDGQGTMWRMTRPVGAGQPIYASSVEPIPIVSKGKKVTLLFEGSHIRLSIPVLALQDGGTGESIMVRNLQSKKQVLARVVDSRTVLIRASGI